jgi:hypothetical protein
MNTHLMSTTIEKAYILNNIIQTFDNCEIEWKSKLNILTKKPTNEREKCKNVGVEISSVELKIIKWKRNVTCVLSYMLNLKRWLKEMGH